MLPSANDGSVIEHRKAGIQRFSHNLIELAVESIMTFKPANDQVESTSKKQKVLTSTATRRRVNELQN